MRGQWQSQTRRLNRHYQSVIQSGPGGEIIPGFIDLNELTEIEEFEYIYNGSGQTGWWMQIDSYDLFNERNSANTIIYTQSDGNYAGIFGYSGEPAVAKMTNRIFDSYKTTFNPIGNKYYFTTKTYDGVEIGSTSPTPAHIDVSQEIRLPLYPKSNFPNWEEYVTIKLKRVKSDISLSGSNLKTVFDIDAIIANGTFYNNRYKQIEYGDEYFINSEFYCIIEVNNTNHNYFNTKADLINYLNQEFVLFPTLFNGVNVSYHPSATYASCKYQIPKVGFDEVYRYA